MTHPHTSISKGTFSLASGFSVGSCAPQDPGPCAHTSVDLAGGLTHPRVEPSLSNPPLGLCPSLYTAGHWLGIRDSDIHLKVGAHFQGNHQQDCCAHLRWAPLSCALLTPWALAWALAEPPVLRTPMVPKGKSAGPIHKLLLLNHRSFSFSKKQGHKWLAGILLTEVWASDWIPHSLGIEREKRPPRASTASSVRNSRRCLCLLTAYPYVCAGTDRQTHGYRPTDTHRHKTHTLVHPDTQLYSPADTLEMACHKEL